MSNHAMLSAVSVTLVSVMLAPAAFAATDTKDAVRVAGQLTKIEGNTLTIAPAEGPEALITCNDTTKLSRVGETSPVKLEDLKVGLQVRAYYSKTDNTAFAVIIAKPEAASKGADTKDAVRVAGQLTKIDGNTLTIVPGEGQEAVITCNDATKLSRDGDKSPVKIEDLKVGLQVRAYYSKTDKAAFAVIIAKAPTANPAQ